MAFKPVPSGAEPKGDREVLSWMLDVLTRASIARIGFLNYQRQIIQDIVKIIEIDKETGRITRFSELYCAAHSNLIFSTIQSIESFHGALTASDQLARNNSDLNVICKILLDPRDYKGGTISILQKKSLSYKMKCNLASIPRLDVFDESSRKELYKMFRPCFKRFELCGRYSSQYWKVLKPVRDIFAHNYRFVFFDGAMAKTRPQLDEALIGFVSNTENNDEVLDEGEIRVKDLLRNLVFVGALQRWASTKLISHLGMFERWIYQNMRSRIANNDNPVLPEAVPFMESKYIERYNEIRAAQAYDFTVPKREAYGEYNKQKQEEMHHRFLKELQDLGEQITMHDPNGRELKLQFLDRQES
jgi:hypothetical protein